MEMNNNIRYDMSILVVLYNKRIDESNTLNAILSHDLHIRNCKLTIWNNGPLPFENVENSLKFFGDFNVEIKETLSNISLAKIYNNVISCADSNKYIILDDDSFLTYEYFKDVGVVSSDCVCFPIIQCGEKIIGPEVNSNCANSPRICRPSDTIMSIGSGIVIGQNVAAMLIDKFGSVFDERFYLYGVDTTFCLRINSMKLDNTIRVINGFKHSLSRKNKESNELSKFRVKERAYDVGLTLRYYSSKSKAITLIVRCFLGDILRVVGVKSGYTSAIYLTKAYIFGKHYRDK
jgi:hypothetical protein